MSDSNLDLSNVISVSIQASPSGLGVPNINTLALFSKETPTWSDDYKLYVSANDVATDFGSSSKAAKIAAAVFSQQPNPLNTFGYLVIVKRKAPGGIFDDVPVTIAQVLSKIYFFGVIVDEKLASDKLAALATYMQTIDKTAFYATDDHTDFAPAGPLDLLRSGSFTHTRGLCYTGAVASDTQAMAAAYAGRALSTDFSGTRTAQTMHLKGLATITPDTNISQTDLVAAQTAGVDLYVNIAGVASVFTSGKNGFFDELYNEFWLKLQLMAAGFNYLRQTNTKIPQTEVGMEGLKNEYRKVLQQGVVNGFLARGSWSSPDTFGNPDDLRRCITDIGYFVYSQPITQQLQVDRAARLAPLIQIAVKTAGAVHKSSVIVNINL